MNKKYSTAVGNSFVIFLAIVVMSLMSIASCSPVKTDSDQGAIETTAVTNSQFDALKKHLLKNITEIINSDKEMSTNLKSTIANIVLLPFEAVDYIQVFGDDVDLRPVFVSVQKAFEQSMISLIDTNKVKSVIAVIHTRLPPTPLCNRLGDVQNESIDSSMVTGFERKKTIQDRTVTLRQMARYGKTLSLYAAYPQNGVKARSAAEMAIYNEEVADSNNVSLHDSPLNLTTMPDEIVGASYILTMEDGGCLFFGLKGIQAIDARDSGSWKYWFGDLKKDVVKKRYDDVFNYLKEGGLVIPVCDEQAPEGAASITP